MGQARRSTSLGRPGPHRRTVESRAELTRENQQQMIAMTADLDQRALGDVMVDVKRVLAAHPAPRGIRVEIAGQYAGQQEAFRALLIVLGLAAVSVIAVDGDPISVVHRAASSSWYWLLPVSFVGAIALLLVTLDGASTCRRIWV